jgi:hypothetical protein
MVLEAIKIDAHIVTKRRDSELCDEGSKTSTAKINKNLSKIFETI